MLTSIVSWYLMLQLIALAGLPVAFATLRRLPSRGYAAAKALGLLLSGVVFWWGSILHLWGNTQGAALAAVVMVAGIGLVLMRGQWDAVRPWWRRHRAHVLIVEGLFLATLVLWALVRSSQPQLETAGGEKWMEIAFLNATVRAPTLPPHDPWLSGFAISYYYLGYLLLGLVTHLTGIIPSMAFNLGNAGWFAMVAVVAYGLVYDMLDGRGRSAIRALLAPLVLLVTGNGEGLLEVFHARGLFSAKFWEKLDIERLSDPPAPPFSWIPQRFFWWWQASRTLRDRTPWGDTQMVIDEFPAFSFILGDMHPHLLALPFVLVAITLALNGYRRAAEAVDAPAAEVIAPPRWHDWVRRWAPVAGYAVVLGTLGFLNTWDFPIYWALLVGAWILGRYARAEQRTLGAFFNTVWQTVPEAFVLGVLSVAFYAPFWFALRSQAGGILPNLFNATQIQHFVVMFLPLLVPVTGLILGSAHRRRLRWDYVVGLGIAFMLGIALVALLVGAVAAYPYLMAILNGESVQGYTLSPEEARTALVARLSHPWVGLLLALGVGSVLLSLVQARWSRRLPREGADVSPISQDTFPLLLVMLGLLLTLAPEFVYLQDVFMTRMNTIFKFYFQAWILWSLAAAWQLGRWLEPPPDMPRTAWRWVGVGLSAVLIAAGLVYTVLAVPARAQEHGVPWTLDGAAWLRDARPGDDAAIRWLNTHVTGAPVIVEAPGDNNSGYVYEGRVSALTGLPTVLGWAGHERQWRGNYNEQARREVDLELLFTTPYPDVAHSILERYDVTYIYIGPVERGRYPAEGLTKFGAMFPAVYAAEEVTIYQVVRAAPDA